MKKLTFFATMTIVALVFASCNKNDYSKFVGTWGVEKIEYYNIDYAGNPIAASLTTYLYDPNDTDNGIQLVFRENRSGEMRNGSIDTIWMNENYIVCPDTVIVTGYTYSFDFETSVLSMNMEYGRTFALQIVEQNADAFVYELCGTIGSFCTSICLYIALSCIHRFSSS